MRKIKLNSFLQKTYASALSMLLALPLVAITTTPANAATVACGTSGTPAVTFLSDPTFHVSNADSYDANYIGYKVTPSSAVKDLWVGLSGFTGGIISLAPSQSQYQSSGAVAANASVSTYFLAQGGTTASTTAQGHTVTVYEGNPNTGAATALCTATNSFTRIDDTITANANKVNTITVSSATGTLGATVDVVVQGDTGTIGNGPAYDAGVINLAPTVKSSFPANAWRLKKIVYNDTTNSRTFTDVIHLTGESGKAYSYTATYSFVAVGTTNTAATLLPIQYIASGTQVKHTGGLPATLPTVPAVANSLTVSKTASVSQLPYTGGDVEYTVTVNNSGAATSIDELVDTMPTGATFKAGSATKGGVAISDPNITGSVATFVGPYAIPASSNVVFKYKLTYGAVTGNYNNKVVGYVSSTQIDTTLSTSDNSPAAASIFVIPYPPIAQPVSATITGPNSYTFTPVNTQSGSTHIPASNCIINPTTSVCGSSLTTLDGTWTVVANGDITFQPNSTFTGVTTADFKIVDSYGQTSTAKATITVVLPPKPVVTAVVKSLYGWSPDTVTVPYTGVGVPASSACFIVDSTCVKTYTATGQGVWTIESDGKVTFDPDFGYSGTTTPVSYRVTDQYGQTASNTVTYIVTAPTAPILSPLSGTTNFDTNIQYVPSTSNSISLDPTTVCIMDSGTCKKSITIANQGTYTVDATTGVVTFDPVRGFTGAVTQVTYKAKDVYGQESSSTINTTVREPLSPTLADKSLNTPYNTPVSGSMTATKGDGNITAFCIISGSNCVTELVVDGEGTWTINNSGNLTFTPERYFSGPATNITVKTTDEFGKTATATGSATVGIPSSPVGDPKTGVALWHSPVTIKPTVTGEKIDWTTFCIVDPADSVCKKSFTIAGTGTFTVDPVTGETTFMPAPTFTGLVPNITYQVKDGWGQTASNTLGFSAGLPSAPTLSPIVTTTPYNTAKTFTPTMTSEADVDNTKFCIIDGANCVKTKTITEGTFTVDATTGEVTFTPVAHFAGAVPQQTYRGENIFGQKATTTIDVTVLKPAAPKVAPLTDSVGYRVTSTQTPSATGTDVDYTTTCIVTDSGCVTELVVDGEGTWTVDASNKIVFTPERLFYGNATKQTYRVTDAYGQSGTSTVDVTVAAPPAAPTVSPVTGTTPFDTNITKTPSVTNSSVIDGSKTCIISGTECVRTLTVTGEGTYTVDANGDITFNPERGFTGAATQQTFRVEDEYGFTGINTIDITVEEPAAPTLNDASGTTPYNTPKTVTPEFVKGDGNASDYCIVTADDCVKELTVDGKGTWTINNKGDVTFTSTDGFAGDKVEITVEVTDEFGKKDTAKVEITVELPNAPVANPATESTLWHTPVDASPTVTGTKLDWSTFCIVDPADSVCKTSFTTTDGSYSLDQTTHKVTFTPAATFTGNANSITYEIKDAWGQKATSTINFVVGLPDAPTIDAVIKTTPFNTATTFTPTAHSDATMDAKFCIMDGTSCVTTKTITEGTFTVDATTGEVTFTPAAHFAGAVPQQTYRGENIFGQTATNTIDITVSKPAAPTVGPLSTNTPWYTPVSQTPSATGTDVDYTTVCIVTADDCVKELVVANEGTWTVNATTGAITFTPVYSFYGNATQQNFQISDAYGQSASSTIDVTVEDPASPTVSDESTTTPYNTAKIINLTTSKGDGTINDFCIVTADSCVKELVVDGEGTWTVDNNGKIVFTPEDGFTGQTTGITVQMTDDLGKTDTASVTVEVEVPAALTVDPLSDTTPFNTPVYLTAKFTGEKVSALSLCIIEGENCVTTLTVDGEGTWTVDYILGAVKFTPVRGFTGAATQQNYRMSDAWNRTSSATLDVTVSEPATPTVSDESKTTPYNTSVDVTPSIVKGDGDITSICIIDGETCVTSKTVTGEGTWSVDKDGKVTFTPADHFTGDATPQTLKATDEFGKIDTGVLNVKVSLPTPPTADHAAKVTLWNTPASVEPAITGTDLDWNTFCIVDPSDSVCKTSFTTTEGSYVLDQTTHKVTFTPASGFNGAAPHVHYRITDGYGQTATNTVQFSVGLPDAPALNPIVKTTPHNTPVSFTPTATTDADMDLSEYCIVTADDCVKELTIPAGTFKIDATTGEITFTPANGFAGNVPQQTLRGQDTFGQTDTTTIDITVSKPAAPTISPLTGATPFDTDITKTPSVTNSSILDTSKTCIVTADGCVKELAVKGEGTWTVNNDGTITFDPARGFTGNATQQNFRVEDNYGQTATSTIDVTVEQPTAPTLDDVSGTTPYNTAKVLSFTATKGDGDISSFCITYNSACVMNLTVKGEGTWLIDSATGNIQFTPEDGFTGTTTKVDVQVTDEFGKTDMGTAEVTVELPDVPAADPATKTTPWNTAGAVGVTVTGTKLDWSTFCIVDPADSVCKTTVIIAGEGTYIVDTAKGEITFTPVSTFTGGASTLTYNVEDAWNRTATNTVKFTVELPTAPSIAAVTKTTPFNTEVKATPAVTSEAAMDSKFCIMDGTSCVTTKTITEGTFTVDATTGEVTFTPANGFAGAVPQQTYRGENVFGQTATNTIDITVSKPAAPVASPISDTTAYNTPVTQSTSVTGTNIDYTTVCFISGTECVKELTITGQGTYTIDANNKIVFTPAEHFYGKVNQIQYRVTDAYSQTATSTVDVTVNEPYVAPEALPLSGTTPWNTSITKTALTKDSTPFITSTTCLISGTECVTTLTVTGEGTYAVNTDGEVTFTPVRTFFGKATQQTYRITDDVNRTSTSTVDFTVSDPAGPTLSDAKGLETPYNTDKTVNLTALKGDGDITDFCIVTDSGCVKELTVPNEGTWTVDKDGKLTFSPVDGFTGETTGITVKVIDEFGKTDTADVDVTVKLPTMFTVNALSDTKAFNTPAYVTPAWTGTNVSTLSTCIIDPADSVCKTTVTIAHQGKFTVSKVLNVVSFVPVHGFSGQVTRVTYQMADSWNRTATNTIDINIGDPKHPTVDKVKKTTPYKTAVTAEPTYTKGDGELTNKCIIVNSACASSLTVNGEGTWTIDSTTGAVTFTPVEGFTGDATGITVQTEDEFGITALGTVNVEVMLPDAPTASPASKVTLWNTPATVGVTVTGTDIDWSTFCIVDPADSACKTTVTIAGEGTYTVDTNKGEVTFTPVYGFTGTGTSLTYNVTDAYNQTATSTVQFSVGIPTAPSIAPIIKTTPYDTAVKATPSATSEANMDDTKYCIMDGANCVTTKTITEGTFTVNTTTGEITFTPASKFYGTVPQQTLRGENVFGQTATATIDITVEDPAPPVVAPERKKTTPYNTPKVIDLTITKGDGDISKVCITSGATCVTEKIVPNEGTWTVTKDGKLTFTPVDGFTGDTTPVEIVVEDEFGQKDTTDVTVNVEKPALPTVNALSKTTPWNTSTMVTPSFNGEQPNNSLTCIIDPEDSACKTTVTVAGQGTYTYSSYLGKIVFTPVSSFVGKSTKMTYRMSDIWGRTATNTIDITVSMPTPPAAGSHNSTVPFEGATSFTLNTSHTAPLDKVCFIVNSECVTTATVNGGTYTINSQTGQVQFTASALFQGPVAELTYRIYDTFGQYASNTINITVEAPDSGPRNPEYANINGIIWLDLNHNNIKDGNEPLLPNVPVTLTEDGTPASTSNTMASIAMSILGNYNKLSTTYTVYTDAQGKYSFTVQPGAYTLTAKINTNRLDPSWDSTGDTDWTVPVVLAANEEAVADFATAGSGSMQGKVIFDNNEIIPNAKVTCTWEGIDGIMPSDDDVQFSFETDLDGNFLVTGIPGGKFICAGQDPQTGKASETPIEVEVDQTQETPAEAEMVVPTEVDSTPVPPQKKPQLAYTGTNVSLYMTAGIGSLMIGLLLTFAHMFLTRRKRHNEI